MMQALFATLGKKGLISQAEAADVIGEAEEFLAGLKPSMMSDDGREYAKRVLQQIGKTVGGG